MSHPSGPRPRPPTAALLSTLAAVAMVLLIGGYAMFVAITPTSGTPATAPFPTDTSPVPRPVTTFAAFFPPKTYQGQGPALVRIVEPATGEGLITLTHAGSTTFIVTTVDATGAERTIVNAAGRYQGTRLIGSRDGATRIAALRIQADGAWTATAKPLLQAQVWNGPTIQGQGDQILRLDRPIGRHTVARASHPGKGTFTILVNGVGPAGVTERQVDAHDAFSGEFLLKTGATFVDIQADGPWSLSRD
jgi:hypothetical protein